MTRYLVRRILIAIPTLIAMSFILFMILALAPGDPMSQFAANPAVPPEVRENIKRSLGLDQPAYIRYIKWVTAAAQGDLGYSFASRVPVVKLIWQRLPTTLWIVGTAYLLAVAFAIPIGVISAVRKYSVFDQTSTTFSFIGFSMPTFFTGTLFIIIFSVKLGWLPFIYDSTLQVTSFQTLIEMLKQSIMPIAVLMLFQMATLTRFTRSSMLDNLPQDYVRTARAKGLREQVVIRGHVLRNSLIPVVTLIALSLPAIFTGAIVTEQIFRVPGIGDLLINSIFNSDTPVVMAIVFISAVLVVFFNLVVDVIYAFLDPRIKYD
ncbi:MAG: ABC transporter permease [Anaerolineae bacterium]